MKPLRVYLDTSAVGGCEDEEFREASLALLQGVKDGRLTVLISDLLVRELAQAPASVRSHLPALGSTGVAQIITGDEACALANRYLETGVVGPTCSNDALHVALATVGGADVVASWNFKHIVHLDKVRGFNAVNRLAGYPPIDIRSPLELI